MKYLIQICRAQETFCCQQLVSGFHLSLAADFLSL